MQFTKALQHTIGWKMLNTILVFFINLLLVRLMGPAASGSFFYAIAALSFIILLFSCSIESGITYYGSSNPTNIPALSYLLVPWLLLLAAVCWFSLNLVDLYTDRLISWLFVISNLTIILCSALYYSRKWFMLLNLLTVIVNGLVLVALWSLYYFNTDTVAGMMEAYSLPANIYISGFLLTALSLLSFLYVRIGIKSMRVNSRELVKKVFAYSLVAFLSNILFFLVTRVDYFFVEKYCDDIALGNYVQVSKMGQMLIMLPSMVAVVLFPFSAGGMQKDYLDKLQSACRIVSIFFIPVVLVVALMGYWILPWLFGKGFNQMYPAMLLYLPGFYALSLVTMLAAYLAGRAMLFANLTGTLIALALMITGDLLLIPLYGIKAAAATSSLAYTVCLCYLLYIYKQKLGCRYADFFMIRKIDLNTLMELVKKNR